MKSLSFKVVILSSSNLVIKIGTVLTGILVVRLLTQEQLGSFRQVEFILGIASTILLLGIPNSIYFFVPKAQEIEKRGIVIQTILTLFVIGLSGSLILYIFAPELASLFNNYTLTPILRRYSLYLPINLTGVCFISIMMCHNKEAFVSIARVIFTSILIISTIIPIVLRCSLLTVFTVLLASNLVISLFSVWYSIKVTPKGPLLPVKGFWIDQFRFSLPLGLSQMIGILNREIDKLFISMFFLVKEFAIYSVGAMEVPISSLIAPSIGAVVLPVFVKDFQENKKYEIVNIWKESRRKLALVTFPVIAYFFFISTEFITLLYGDRYTESVVIFQIYLLIPVLINIESSVILHANGKTRLMMYTSIIQVALNIILNYILIRKIGPYGPPIATAISLFIGCSIIIYWVERELDVSWLKLFPMWDYAIIIISCFFAGLPLMFLKHSGLISSDIMFVVTESAIFGLIILFSYIFFILNRNDIESLLKYTGKVGPVKEIINSVILHRWGGPEDMS